MTNPRNDDLGIYGTGESWHDNFRTLQQPRIDPGQDPLAQFVNARIIELETEPRGEIDAVYDLPAGPVAYRYAKHVRADCVAFRRIVAQHLKHHGMRDAVRAIAMRWADHPEFRQEWSLQ